jgi:hypothetical protein
MTIREGRYDRGTGPLVFCKRRDVNTSALLSTLSIERPKIAFISLLSLLTLFPKPFCFTTSRADITVRTATLLLFTDDILVSIRKTLCCPEMYLLKEAILNTRNKGTKNLNMKVIFW